MSTLSAQIQGILSSSVQPPAGAAGLVFGAINRNAKVLVAEAAGVSTLNRPEPVRQCVL